MPEQTCGNRHHGAVNTYHCDKQAGHDGLHGAHRDGEWIATWGSDGTGIAIPEQAADDPQGARQARRAPLLHLLNRLSRGVLLDAERFLLRGAVETEIADGDQAHEAFANVLAQRDADCAAYNATVNVALREAEQHRQQLAAALGEARGRNWPHLIGRAESVIASYDEVKQKLAASETLGHRLLQRAEAAEAAAVADERRADKAEADLNLWRTGTYEHARRADEAVKRAETAEAALARIRDALDGVGPLARNHIERALNLDAPALDGDQPAETLPTTPVTPRMLGGVDGDHPVHALRCALEGPPVQHYEATGLIKAYYDAITGAPPADPEHTRPDGERRPGHDQPSPDLAAAVRAYMGVALPLVTHLARTLGITPGPQ